MSLWLISAPAMAEMRAWTDSSGRKVQAEFAGMQGDSVLLKLSADKTIPYPVARLSAADQAFIQAQSQTPVASADTQQPTRTPIEKRTWPATVEVPAKSVEIAAVSESAADRKFVYRSAAFEFTSQAKLAGSVMKEVARTFEATKTLVEALPWGIVCRPPNGMPRFLAALYETKADYVAAGGPEMSGGVYSRADNIFKIPFPSLGMEKRGQTYYKDDSYSNGTLVHEITHQLMDEYLTFLPTWIIEGTAEYTEMLPYKAGIFRSDSHKNGLKEDVGLWAENEGFRPDIGNLEAHMTMTRDQWDAACSTPQKMRDMYHRSQLLVYYFCHLDGDGKGTRFIQYMEAVHGEVSALRSFFADPRVKRLEGGRFTYPREIKPPDMDGDSAPFKHLGILTAERPYAKIAAEIIEGYKSIGLKVQVQ